MKQISMLVFLAVLGISKLQAQHEHPAPKTGTSARSKDNSLGKDSGKAVAPATGHGHQHTDSMQKGNMDDGTHGHQVHDTAMGHQGKGPMVSMSHAYSLNLPMTRNGSGTGWLPDASPMYGYMIHSKRWMYMIHGNIFIRYNKQDITNKGVRGAEKWDAPNMVMFMGQRNVGKRGLFHFSTMVSLDNVVTGGSGYPLLFQTGETFEGRPLIDRQHPHDLFSELSVSYSHAFNRDIDAFVYLAYPGEPAIGPVTFMHRPSGMDNPDAPLSHHWIDATHITFGVATLGLRFGRFKLEGSSFTGREPDEDRYDFDKPRFDSRSGRLSFNPGRHWALQLSHAFIKTPETLHPHNVYRTTASATYAYQFGSGILFNATGLWGMNKVKDHDGEHAALVEASLRIQRLVAYGRFEWVQKSVEELALDEDVFGHDAIFPVNALTMGLGYDLLQLKPVRTAIGVQLTRYHADSRLDPLYGKNPLAGQVYLRIYPDLMR